MEKLDLQKILDNHKEWLKDRSKGKRADLNGADLSGTDLNNINLYGANLHRADLRGTDLRYANLNNANFSNAVLIKADLSEADLSEADLSGADLSKAVLDNTDLSGADLSRTFLNEAKFIDSTFHQTNFKFTILYFTTFNNVDLLELIELENCRHYAKSYVDIHSLLKTGHKLPKVFLRGIGLPDNFIEYFPSLSESAFQLYSCFISYSHKDKLFAKKLHNDLQNKGVRCWFAPEDMKIGAKVRDTIHEAIRIKDKLLVIMSKESVNSDWVEEEVEKALAEEKSQNKLILFPVRIDDEVMKMNKAWAEKIMNGRHIGDFTKWKEPVEYEKSFNRLLRDLKVNEA